MAESKVRVHNLAKELQVPSKVIIDKCRAEGIEIKNHMHVVSAGLEATIREWFSEGAHTTTLEEANRVDLETIRAKREARKKKAAHAPAEGVSVATIEAPEEAEAEAAKKPSPRRKSPKEVAVEHEAPVAVMEPSAAPPAVEVVTPQLRPEPAAPTLPGEAAPPSAPTPAHVAPAPGAAAAAAEAPEGARAAMPEAPAAEIKTTAAPGEAHPKPGPKPRAKPPAAGPQNVPKPAQLTGPRVVRFDKPEIERDRPRPMARPGGPPRAEARARGGLVSLPETEEEERAGRRKGGPAKSPDAGPATDKRAHPRRTIRDTSHESIERLREWRDRDLIERRDRLAQASGRGIGGLRAIEGKHTARRSGQRAPLAHVKKDKVALSEPIVVRDFSRETGITVNEIVKKLMQDHGVLATINTGIDTEVAHLIAAEYGIELDVIPAKTGVDRLAEEFAAIERKNLQTRPPIVTILGHVDHGKTSLLDRIRRANVTASEAGGITQHIGAYRVKVGDKWVTFLDTPGHTAFTAMRARGTTLTDVVVLVVAADDGVMPTTVEAINHAKAAKTPIVVALNKIDLPHDLNKIYGQLAEQGLTPSGDWGGDTDVIKTSAITGEGIDDLLSHLATLSEVMEFKADPTIPAAGTVIEAERSGSLGNVARLMVQDGTLRAGDVIVCGPAYGRTRSLTDDTGKIVKKAGPSTPVEVSGLSEVPMSGDRFYVLDSLQKAKDVAQEVLVQRREKELIRVAKPTSLESMLARRAEGEIPELRIIIRADVQGSVDVLQKTLSELPSDQVRLNILHAGVGTVTESDVVLAKASEAIIIAFHVAPEPAIQRKADEDGVDIRSYRVIYNALDDIRAALEGLLTPDEKIESRGRAEVREVFNISRVGRVAGCYVRDGTIERNHMVRVVRDGVIVKDRGAIDSLRRFKDDVKEARAGMECGLRITDFNDLKPGDVIEAFEVVKVARKLDS
ncbi:MAG TPA: translation initiation factor IF-2 [Phycisphaerae bacterium]|nr:translation initiation factor IF-2 [Phycisphaerae bacterium]